MSMNPGGAPTASQIERLDELVDQKLEGVECQPAWSIHHQTPGLKLSISRNVNCTYKNGDLHVQPNTKTIGSLKDLFLGTYNGIEITAGLNSDGPLVEDSEIVQGVLVKVSDLGHVAVALLNEGHLGLNLASIAKSVDTQDNKLANNPMAQLAVLDLTDKLIKVPDWNEVTPSQEAIINQSLVQLVEYTIRENNTLHMMKSLGPEAEVLEDLASGIAAKIAGQEGIDRNEPYVQKGIKIASNLIALTTASGKPYLEVGRQYHTQQGLISVSKDPFNSGYLGNEVVTVVGVDGNDLLVHADNSAFYGPNLLHDVLSDLSTGRPSATKENVDEVLYALSEPEI